MNNRIRELRRKATLVETYTSHDGSIHEGKSVNLEKFAELIVKECAKIAWYNTPDTEELEYSHLIKDKILNHFGVEE